MRIVLHLPFPVSTNHIWRHRGGRGYLSERYKAWQKEAGQEWLAQRKNQPKAISGRYGAILIFTKPDKRKRDLDNLIKGVKDFLVDMAVIDDDNLCEKLYVRWGTKKEAPLGSKVILKSMRP